MGVAEILAQIDNEIAQLQKARNLLAGSPAAKAAKKSAAKAVAKAVAKTKKKRNISPEGRRKIQEAVKRRWAEQRKAVTKA